MNNSMPSNVAMIAYLFSTCLSFIFRASKSGVARLAGVTLCAVTCALWLSTPASADFDCKMCHRGLTQETVKHLPVLAGKCDSCHRQRSNNHPLGGEGSMGFVASKTELCVKCHTKLLTKKMLHSPAAKGECTSCHLPHSSANMALLKDLPPTFCFGCHAREQFTGPNTHPPVAQGKCLSCHDPHQSEGTNLLRKQGADLCFGCHPQKQFTASHAHPPVAQGKCLSCHDPHRGDGPKQLRKQGGGLCFRCHDAKLAQGKSVHPPVARGECSSCHSVHGSPHRQILKADYPSRLFNLNFSKADFQLCFSCHTPEMFTAKKTTTATNFRNGDLNLHAVHVGQGRSCRICHNPHASAQDKLINPKSPAFGGWEIPIGYTRAETGGGCSVGCHRIYRYDRENPVAN